MAEQKNKEKQKKFLTVVLQYDEPTRKNDTPVTDILYYIVNAIQTYNSRREYNDQSRFDLFGICIEDEEIAKTKNDFVRSIYDEYTEEE